MKRLLTASFLQILERIEAQKRENALIRKHAALKKEVEMAELKRQIAYLEQQKALQDKTQSKRKVSPCMILPCAQ